MAITVMENYEKNIQITRENWQENDANKVADSRYYDKCAEILKKLGNQYIDAQMTIIDLGCADGAFTELLTAYAKKAIGYEFSQTMLKQALQLRASDRLEFFPIDMQGEGWVLPPCQLALCMGVFTYLHEDSQLQYALQEVGRSLKEGGGKIFITRESLSKTQTFRWLTQGRYYSIYRSYDDYYNLFNKNGFEFINEIRLFEDDYVINAFRLWQRENS